MRLSDYEFGFADATKEYTRTPEIFENAFCDPRNIIDKLPESVKLIFFITSLRKQTGVD